MIGDECFGSVRVVELDGLGELESTMIGKKSFNTTNEEQSNMLYRIVNCPKLQSIQIGDWSFSDYHSFELTNLPSLQYLYVGDYCFGEVRLFELNGLGELESVVIGSSSFTISDKERRDGSYRISNCPNLESVRTGYRSFSDYHSFEMTNLASLQSVDIGVRCFFWAPLFSLAGETE